MSTDSTVSDYSEYDWKTQQSLRVKDKELKLKDRELEKNAQELDRMALFCLNTLRDKSDAVIMQTLGWSQAQLDKYRAMASRQ